MSAGKNKVSKVSGSSLKLVAVGGKQLVSQSKQAVLKKQAPKRTTEFEDEVAAMPTEKLSFFRIHLQTDLSVIERELRRREEEEELEHKRTRRVIVDVDDPIEPGELLLSEAGTPMKFIFKGTAWDMTPTAAKRRGVVHLAGRTVCYAHGKPVAADELSPDILATLTDVPCADSQASDDGNEVPF